MQVKTWGFCRFIIFFSILVHTDRAKIAGHKRPPQHEGHCEANQLTYTVKISTAWLVIRWWVCCCYLLPFNDRAIHYQAKVRDHEVTLSRKDSLPISPKIDRWCVINRCSLLMPVQLIASFLNERIDSNNQDGGLWCAMFHCSDWSEVYANASRGILVWACWSCPLEIERFLMRIYELVWRTRHTIKGARSRIWLN